MRLKDGLCTLKPDLESLLVLLPLDLVLELPVIVRVSIQSVHFEILYYKFENKYHI